MESRRVTSNLSPGSKATGIEIFLDGQGEVERAYFQVPWSCADVEKFAQGRPGEDMPQIHVAHLRRLPHGPSHGVEPSAGMRSTR